MIKKLAQSKIKLYLCIVNKKNIFLTKKRINMLIEELIENYKTSKSEDFMRDLMVIYQHVNEVVDPIEQYKTEKEIIEIFLEKLRVNRIALRDLITVSKVEWGMIKDISTELSEVLLGSHDQPTKIAIEEKWHELYVKSSFHSKIYLMSFRNTISWKVAKQEAVKNKLLKNKQENASLQSTTPNYVVDAIRDLESKVGLSPLEYAIQYERIGGRLVQNLKDDLNIEDEQDRRRTFYKVFDVYKCKLQQIEMQADKEYDEMHPMYCADVDFERQMTNDFLTTEDMEDTVKKWLGWLQYRMDVHRSSNNSFIDRMQQKILTWVTNKYN